MTEAYAAMAGCLERDKLWAREWSDKLGLDLQQSENVGIVILAIALVMNERGLVLFSTTRPQRLRTVVQRLNEGLLEKARLLEFRDAVAPRMTSTHAP